MTDQRGEFRLETVGLIHDFDFKKQRATEKIKKSDWYYTRDVQVGINYGYSHPSKVYCCCTKNYLGFQFPLVGFEAYEMLMKGVDRYMQLTLCSKGTKCIIHMKSSSRKTFCTCSTENRAKVFTMRFKSSQMQQEFQSSRNFNFDPRASNSKNY